MTDVEWRGRKKIDVPVPETRMKQLPSRSRSLNPEEELISWLAYPDSGLEQGDDAHYVDGACAAALSRYV